MKLTSNSPITYSDHIKIKFYACFSCYLLFIAIIIIVSGCSGSSKFTLVDDEYKIENKDKSLIEKNKNTFPETPGEAIEIRVLLNESATRSISIQNNVNLFSENAKLALVNKGNTLSLSLLNGKIELTIGDKTFFFRQFILSSAEDNEIIKIDGKAYRGKIRIISNYDNINVINQITLEDYVKGVMTREMPLGKDLENYEALKAFSICARTYAYTKIFEGKTFYDIFPDTRDQVYGGVDSENEYSNSIVDETSGQILTFNNKPAVVFYHSTCGGYTEDATNVFSKVDVPYLKGVKDGTPSNCSISPRYEWTEIIPEYKVIDRLITTGYINRNNYSINKINVNSRFDSGRINELEFVFEQNNGQEISVKLYGNNIRSVIRTADDKSILRSNYFEINKGNSTVIINGKGSGHGVGMCQWGAISLSKNGTNYLQILELYYPGTEIQKIK